MLSLLLNMLRNLRLIRELGIEVRGGGRGNVIYERIDLCGSFFF